MRIPAYLLAVGLLFQAVLAWAETAATVVFATGSPTAIAADGAVRALTRGAEVASGETIDTAAGRVQLRFRDGASMSLLPATRFKIDDYRFTAEDGKASPESKGFFSLIKGGLRTITGLIGKGRREQYRVDTVVATIGVRGTEYGANLADDGLRVSTFAGLVEVCNDGGCELVHPGETAIAEHRERKPRLLNPGATLPNSADLMPQLQAPGTQQDFSGAGRSGQGSATPPTTSAGGPGPSTGPTGAAVSGPNGGPTATAVGVAPTTNMPAATGANGTTGSSTLAPPVLR